MRILVVDDSLTSLMTVGNWLEEMGYSVLLANNANKALQLYQSEQVDGIITDVEMPVINGFELAKKLRKLMDSWKPIIFMSSVARNSYYTLGMASGGDFYFTKPLNKVILTAFMTGVRRMFEMRQSLEKVNGQLAILKQRTIDGIISVDESFNIIDANNAATEMLGYCFDDFINMPLHKVIHFDNAPLELKDSYLDGYLTSDEFNRNGSVYIPQCTAINISHIQFKIEATLTRIQESEGIVYSMIFRNIDERLAQQELLYELAHFDPLTGLPNRVWFSDLVDNKLKENENFTIINLNVHNFKLLNRRFGYHACDNLLVEIGSLLQSQIGDSGFVARLVGDEFMLLLELPPESPSAYTQCEQLIKIFDSPILMKDQEFKVDVYLGAICSSELAFDNSESMLSKVALAVQYCQKLGPSHFVFYDEKFYSEQLERERLVFELEGALEKEEFKPFFQPQICPQTGSIKGAEVLLRWQLESGDMITPNFFIPLLEEKGSIISVTYWLMDKACGCWQAWKKQNLIPKDAKLAINLAANHFSRSDLIPKVKSLLDKHKMPAKDLVLELTETMMMLNASNSQDTLKQLSELGVFTSLDDFGTGYSSLSQISDYAIDEIKIDKSFIDKTEDADTTHKFILESIIKLAHGLNKIIVAEGIDTPEKAELLTELGCNSLQGFLYSEPLSESEFVQWLIESKKNNYNSSE